jgi:hypothetical protein
MLADHFKQADMGADHNNILYKSGLLQCAKNVNQQGLIFQEQQRFVVVFNLNACSPVACKQNGIHFLQLIHNALHIKPSAAGFIIFLCSKMDAENVVVEKVWHWQTSIICPAHEAEESIA